MALEIKPPTPITIEPGRPSLFLAGSIAMGQAEEWQTEVVQALHDQEVTILNPRRDSWDATWPQERDFAPFREQVEWELAGLEIADLVVMYLAPTTQAPISLLELGLCAAGKQMIVCCPPGFWRKGNVDVVCARYGIPQVPDLAALIAAIRSRLAVA